MSAADTSQLGPIQSDEELMIQLAAGRKDAAPGPLHGRYASLIYNVASSNDWWRPPPRKSFRDVFVAVWRRPVPSTRLEVPFALPGRCA